MFSLEDRLAYKGKAGAVMPPSSLCGKPGERCCRWLRHQQGGTCRAGAFADILSCSVFPKRPKGLLKSLSTSHRLCFGSMVAQALQPAGPTGGGGELCLKPHGHLRQGRAALPSVRAGAGRDYRSQHAAACLFLLLLPLLLRPTWQGAGRDATGGVGAGIGRACPGRAGDTAPAAPLQVKRWDECRSTPCCAAPTGKGQGRPAVPPGG